MSKEDSNKPNKLFLEYLNDISSNEGSDSYLREQGLDPDKLIGEGLRKIKQIQMNIAAEATEQNFQQVKLSTLARAKAEVERLLADKSFTWQSFIKTENINMSFRNFEEMSQEEIKEFLERHFMLKFGDDSKNDNTK